MTRLRSRSIPGMVIAASRYESSTWRSILDVTSQPKAKGAVGARAGASAASAASSLRGCCRELEVAEHRRRKVFAVVAGGQHEPPDPLGPPRQKHLGKGAAGVVADQRHLLARDRCRIGGAPGSDALSLAGPPPLQRGSRSASEARPDSARAAA